MRHLNYDKNAQVYIDNVKYYGNNNLKFEIKHDIDYYEAGSIKNGLLTLIYNEIDGKKKIMESFNENAIRMNIIL
jgi:hypothetical protein